MATKRKPTKRVKKLTKDQRVEMAVQAYEKVAKDYGIVPHATIHFADLNKIPFFARWASKIITLYGGRLVVHFVDTKEQGNARG